MILLILLICSTGLLGSVSYMPDYDASLANLAIIVACLWWLNRRGRHDSQVT